MKSQAISGFLAEARPWCASAALAAAAVLVVAAPAAAEEGRIVLETEHFRWTIGADGRSEAFVDLASGKDLLAPDRTAFATVTSGGKTTAPASCALAGGVLQLGFAEPAAKVAIRAVPRPAYIVFEVVSVEGPATGGPAIDEVSFAAVRLALPGRSSGISGVVAGETFAASARALNLRTALQLEGGPTPLLRPTAAARPGSLATASC